MITPDGVKARLSQADRGVSPVIGVILMVAITVILAAVIGTFVLDIGQTTANAAPQASFQVSTNADADEIELEHFGGDRLHSDGTRVVVEVDGGTTTFDPDDATGDGTLSVAKTAVITLGSDDDGLDFDGDGTNETKTDGDADPFDSGDDITVTLIDLDTERIIFERTLTV